MSVVCQSKPWHIMGRCSKVSKVDFEVALRNWYISSLANICSKSTIQAINVLNVVLVTFYHWFWTNTFSTWFQEQKTTKKINTWNKRTVVLLKWYRIVNNGFLMTFLITLEKSQRKYLYYWLWKNFTSYHSSLKVDYWLNCSK